MPSNHRYVNFTDRVAKIRIDPIRKTDQKRNAPDAINSESLFCSALERWDELNLASKYTGLSNNVANYTQSLPMIIHNREKIYDCLESSLQETDIYSAEAFFDLLVNLARDLGEDFEPLYPRALSTCIVVIEKYQRDDASLEVLEHAFNCLAYLYKYLARLITTNLAPTYDLVLPLFGGLKGFKPRGFVLRFAAESMAFLVRRASGENLESIVCHIIQKIVADKSNEQLLDSTTLLLGTTLKGPGITLHSKTPMLVRTYFEACLNYDLPELFNLVIENALHHARDSTAQPIYSEVLEQCQKHRGNFSAQALITLAGLRKGDRVSNWPALYETLLILADDDVAKPSWADAAAAVLCFSDMNSSVSNVKKLLVKAHDEATLFRIMECVSAINPEVFQAFASLMWSEAHAKATHDDMKSLYLLSLLKFDIGKAENHVTRANGIRFFDIDGLVKDLSSSGIAPALFNVWWQSNIGFEISDAEKQTLIQVLIRVNVQDDEPLNAFRSNIVASLLNDAKHITEKNLHDCCQLVLTPKLMDSFVNVIKFHKFNTETFVDTLQSKLYQSIQSCDSRIRSSALKLVKSLVRSEDDSRSLIEQCQLINGLPLDLSTARNICQRLRTLVVEYKHTGNTTRGSRIAARATVHFFFGMLTARLQPVSNVVLDCIPCLAEKDAQLVCDISMSFILRSGLNVGGELFIFFPEENMECDTDTYNTKSYECHNLASFQEACKAARKESLNLLMTLQTRASESLKFKRYDDVRLLGIKALCQIPKTAERLVINQLVPYLLEVKDDDEGEGNCDNEPSSFTFQDRVSLLELFAKLTKPEKLLKFSEIEQHYLYFLRSRHAPLQKLGLKCLYTINKPEIRTLSNYRENFDAFLDDKRFRDELTTFVGTGKGEIKEGSLHPDDRETVMPYVVRILYGRAQNSTKRNMRHAVMSSLHFLEVKFLQLFVDLAHEHLMESNILGTSGELINERDVLRRVQGYLTLMNDLIHHLKATAEKVIPIIITRGIFAIIEKVDLSESKTLRHLLNKSLAEMIGSAPKFPLWSAFFPDIISRFIKPQLENFAVKNLETASAFMKLILTVSNEKSLVPLLNEEIISALVDTIRYSTVKDPVIEIVLRIVLNLTTHAPDSDLTLKTIFQILQLLPRQMDNDLSPESFSIAIELVIRIFDLKLNDLDAKVVDHLADTSLKALSKPSKLVPLPTKARVLLALSQIFEAPQCSTAILEKAYFMLSPLFRQFVARDARVNLSSCFRVFGERLPQHSRVGDLVVELNSFDKERLGEPDFSRRTAAFEEINETLWSTLTPIEWRPIMFNYLFFLRDPEEVALRNNGKFGIIRLIESKNAPDLVNEFILPALKKGLRDSEDRFRRLYIDILSQCAHSNVLPSLDVLLYHGDEEADFFVNINHVQVHRRRRAIQRLGKHASELTDSTIAHYLLSIVEAVAMHSGSKNPELNNFADDALHAITELLRNVTPGQFKSVARRWVQELVQEPEPAKLRKNVRIVTAVAQATPNGLDDFVLNALVSPLHKLLSSKSNEHENLPDRVPVAIAIIYFLKSLNDGILETALPGKLTSLCQMLRSKVPELRDSVRQTLSKIMRILGSKYLKFVISELTGALRRGGMQSHVLGYTVHSILAELNRAHDVAFSIGDTDDSAGMIFKVVMDDTFGYIGDEKDSDGYVTAAKEVKQHKSYDTAEILATWTSLSQFGQIITPVRQFLSSRKLNGKLEHKIEEVLKRLAAGLHRNVQASSQDAVVMGYEVYMLSEKLLTVRKEAEIKQMNAEKMSGAIAARVKAAKESEEFFTVRLSSRDWFNHERGNANNAWTREANATRYASSNMHLLQTFALDTLRSVMTSTAGGAVGDTGKGLLTVANVRGLISLILSGFTSTHEDLNLAALRLATVSFRLPIPFASEDETLKITADRALSFVENSIDTNTLICQVALKYLTMLIRSKPEFELSAGAIAYIFERVRPDLEEPERQSTAISFIRAVFTRKVLLPQIYDIADTISQVLVTNQSEHIRVNCRNAYIQFISTYPLGQTRLNRHLAALATNLRYAAASGRLSVIETIDSLLHKISTTQLESSFIQFYSNLVLVLVSDPEPECREKASLLIKYMITLDTNEAIKEQMADLCLQWLGSLDKNELLVRGGLEVAGLLTSEEAKSSIPLPIIEKIGTQLHKVVLHILKSGQKASGKSIDWQLVYLALDTDVSAIISDVNGVLLFPHPWVRARAARVIGTYFKNTEKSELSINLLTSIGQKLVRQLGAPHLLEADSLQIVKDLVFIIPFWVENNVMIESKQTDDRSETERSAMQWLVHKLTTMIRTDVSSFEHLGGKTGAIQILASLPSLVSPEMLRAFAYDVILGLYVMNEQLAAESSLPDLQGLAQEALSTYNDALGTTEYFKRYTEAQQYVNSRRRERRAKRSIEAVAAPELAAQKRMKRNSHKRDVRKLKARNH